MPWSETAIVTKLIDYQSQIIELAAMFPTPKPIFFWSENVCIIRNDLTKKKWDERFFFFLNTENRVIFDETFRLCLLEN